MSVTAKVEWLKGSDKALGEVGSKATQKNILRRTLTKAAQPIHDTAVAIAPDDPATGAPLDLKTTIMVGPNSKLTKGAKRHAYKAGQLGVMEVHVGTNAPHAHLQEFGTVHHLPQPYMRPAFDANKAHSEGIIKTELWAEIRKAVLRAARKRSKVV